MGVDFFYPNPQIRRGFVHKKIQSLAIIFINRNWNPINLFIVGYFFTILNRNLKPEPKKVSQNADISSTKPRIPNI